MLTKPVIDILITNGQPNETGKDHVPVTKLYMRNTGLIWLLTEINPENLYEAFGLYDGANGNPILGDIDLNKVMQVKAGKLRVERDPYFVGKYPISFYHNAAQMLGYITEVDSLINPPGNRPPPSYTP